MNTEPVLITREYLKKHATKRGAHTKKQIEALGLEWMPTKGWQSRLIGEVLTAEKADIFETENTPVKSKGEPNKIQSKLTIDKAIQFLFNNAKQLNHNDIIRLRNIESKFIDLRKSK